MMRAHFIKPLNGFFILMILMSCSGGKQEFISLDHMTFTNSYYRDQVKISYYVLIANPDADNGKLKNTVIQYVRNHLRRNQRIKQSGVHSLNFVFYKKTGKTSYFIKNNEAHDALHSEEISNYTSDYIANYYVAKCEGGFTEKLYFFDRQEEIVSSSCK